MELTIRKSPRWLETYMRNLNPDNFEELREAIVRYLGSQKWDDNSTKRTDRSEKSRTQMSDTPNRNREPEPRRLEMRNRKDATHSSSEIRDSWNVSDVGKRGISKEIAE